MITQISVVFLAVAAIANTIAIGFLSIAIRRLQERDQ